MASEATTLEEDLRRIGSNLRPLLPKPGASSQENRLTLPFTLPVNPNATEQQRRLRMIREIKERGKGAELRKLAGEHTRNHPEEKVGESTLHLRGPDCTAPRLGGLKDFWSVGKAERF